MSSDDYQVQNIYKYARKSYKKNCRKASVDPGGISVQEDTNIESDQSPRREGATRDLPNCSCDVNEGELASILHKKCPVITLARQQLQRITEDYDNGLSANTRSCRSIYDFLCLCREMFQDQNKYMYLIIFATTMAALFMGLLLGAASCGTYIGRFNSPLLTCLDNFFITDKAVNIDFRGLII